MRDPWKFRTHIKSAAAVFIGCLALFCIALLASAPLRKAILLPTSKFILGPVPGDPKPMGAFPVNVAISPDGRHAAILEAGFGLVETEGRQSVSVVELATNKITRYADPRLGQNARQTLFLGIAWSSDGTRLYVPFSSISDPTGVKDAEENTGNGIAIYRFASGEITPERFLPIAPQPMAAGKKRGTIHKEAPEGALVPYPAGIAVMKKQEGDQLLVADNLSDDVLLMDISSGKIIRRFDVSRASYIPGAYPYAVVANSDGSKAWVSLWNASSVAELNLEAGKVERYYALRPGKAATDSGSHPSAIALHPKNKNVVFVTLSTTDEVAVIDTLSGKVAGYFSTALPKQEFRGAYPNSLAFDAEGNRLFVANAGSDAVAIFPIAERLSVCVDCKSKRGVLRFDPPTPSGFIPTEWYPTAVAMHGSDELLIATGKGVGTGTNKQPREPGQVGYKTGYAYIATLLRGSLAKVDLNVIDKQLETLTAEVLESNLMNGHIGVLPFKDGKNPIKHIVYIIKENRTYDQLFGDLGVGNGDPSLTLYGEEITPNHHQLARQFGVLDNFYVSGDVSGNGHVWSTAATSSDYTEKTWQIGYRSDERTYDFEGQVANDTPIELGIPDVNEPGTGYLWTNLARHKKTFRHYGEYVRTRWCGEERSWQTPQEGTPMVQPKLCDRNEIKPGEEFPVELGGGKNSYQWPIPLMAENIPTKPELRGNYDPNYPDFRMDFPDQLRIDQFLREFNQWVAARKKAKRDPMPQFITLRLPNDHTSGTAPGVASPRAAMADNDLALGRVVEAISNSPYWDDTAIFVLEDDAQDGVDHVDAHRSPAFVISKYSPGSANKPFVDSHFYTTVNLIHTMEVVLGLPPMNNNDAKAPIMASMFSGPGTQPAYKANYRNRDNKMIYQANVKDAPGADESAAMNFRHADGVDTELLNAILWRERKGDQKMPRPKHEVIPVSKEVDDDD